MTPSKNFQKTNKTKKNNGFWKDRTPASIFLETIGFFCFICFLNVLGRCHWFSFVFQLFSLLLTRKPIKTIEKQMKTNETQQKPSKNQKNKKNNGFQEDGGPGPIFPESIFFNVFAMFCWCSFVFQWFSLLLTRKPMKTIEKQMKTNETQQKHSKNK